MITDLDIAWFAGIIDGEGTISLLRHKDTDSKVDFYLTPLIYVGNTSKSMIEKSKQMFSEICGHQIRYYPRPRKNRTRLLYEIRTQKKEDVQKLCFRLLPFLIAKQEQAMLLLQYLQIAPGRGSSPGRTRYDERHIELWAKIKQLNRRHTLGIPHQLPPNDLTGGSQLGMKEKSEPHSNVWSVAEMTAPLEAIIQ